MNGRTRKRDRAHRDGKPQEGVKKKMLTGKLKEGNVQLCQDL